MSSKEVFIIISITISRKYILSIIPRPDPSRRVPDGRDEPAWAKTFNQVFWDVIKDLLGIHAAILPSKTSLICCYRILYEQSCVANSIFRTLVIANSIYQQ
jgi:hypothetical protein